MIIEAASTAVALDWYICQQIIGVSSHLNRSYFSTTSHERSRSGVPLGMDHQIPQGGAGFGVFVIICSALAFRLSRSYSLLFESVKSTRRKRR